MHPREIHAMIVESDHKTWQLYLLIAATLVCASLYFDIGPFTDALRTLEGSAAGLEWFVILAIQGTVIGFVAEFLYEQGDRYVKVGDNEFDTKDRALGFRIGAMTAVSAIVTVAVPRFVEAATEYLVIQTFGAVIVLGILLVHLGSPEWDPLTEWPALTAGVMLAVAPSVL